MWFLNHNPLKKYAISIWEKKKELSSAKDFLNGELVYKCKYFKLIAISSFSHWCKKKNTLTPCAINNVILFFSVAHFVSSWVNDCSGQRLSHWRHSRFLGNDGLSWLVIVRLWFGGNSSHIYRNFVFNSLISCLLLLINILSFIPSLFIF